MSVLGLSRPMLEAGGVAERGRHAELIRSDGAYQRLWHASREEASR